jgi:hypothetical protein
MSVKISLEFDILKKREVKTMLSFIPIIGPALAIRSPHVLHLH